MNDGGLGSADAAADARYVSCACPAPDGGCPPQCLFDCATAAECMELPDDVPPTYEGRRAPAQDGSTHVPVAPDHGGCVGCAVNATSSGLYAASILLALAFVVVARRRRRWR